MQSHYHFREMQNYKDNDYGHHDLGKREVDVVLVRSVQSSWFPNDLDVENHDRKKGKEASCGRWMKNLGKGKY